MRELAVKLAAKLRVGQRLVCSYLVVALSSILVPSRILEQQHIFTVHYLDPIHPMSCIHQSSCSGVCAGIVVTHLQQVTVLSNCRPVVLLI